MIVDEKKQGIPINILCAMYSYTLTNWTIA